VTKLSGALPKDAALNGMHAIERQLINQPEDEHLVLMWVGVSKLTTAIESGEVEATLHVVSIEPVLPGDITVADKLMRAARSAHSGQHELEIDGLTVTKGTGEVIDGPWNAQEIDGSGVVRVPADKGLFREPGVNDEPDDGGDGDEES